MLKLYYADTSLVENQMVFDNLMEKVNEQRRRKVLRCKNEEDKKRSLLVGVLLRHALEQQGLLYDEQEFSVTAEGKPILKSHPEISFSLSHSGNRVVCLISDSLVGVDIENRYRRLFEKGQEERFLAVARRSFSKQEYAACVAACEEEQKELFLKYWTRKEAVSKAVGKGLAMDFSKIEEAEDKFISFWLDENYYLSIYREMTPGEELVMEEICRVQFE